MTKNILIVLMVLATLFAIAFNVASRKAPQFLRSSIEQALNRKVVIQSIEYQFPWGFRLQGFEIQEPEPFQGEASFSVDQIRLEVSPLSFPNKKLIIDKIQAENAEITIRQYRGRLYHALSGTMQTAGPGRAAGESAAPARGKRAPLPLEIRKFYIERSRFKFVDYDVEPAGFAVAFDQIAASIRGIYFPFSSNRTYYDVAARLVQGRDQKPAAVRLAGWTQFAGIDTDANLSASGIFLPYFRPYYAQVTQAGIEDGYLDARTNIHIQNKDLTATVDLEMIHLIFQSYEEGDQLFGLRADELLSFLKDRSGRLRFQSVIRWNLADRSVRPKDAIRKSMERSLKSAVIGNFGNILQKTIEKISEKGGFEQAKNSPEGLAAKIKNFFK